MANNLFDEMFSAKNNNNVLRNTSPNIGLINDENYDINLPRVSTSDRFRNSSIYDKGISYEEAIINNGIERRRHEQQGFWSQTGSALLQTGTTLVGQTMEGIGYLLDPEMMVNIVKGTEDEWGNWFTKAGQSLIEAGENIAPIYQDPDKQGKVNWGDWSYWMANAPSIISTLSFFIPGLGVAKVAGGIGKAIGMTGKGLKIFEGIIGGLTSRYMESSMEASQTMQEMQQMAGTILTNEQAAKIREVYGVEVPKYFNPETGAMYYQLSEEAAKEMGAKAAANNFKLNQAALITDIPQFMFATAPFGSVTKALTGKMAGGLAGKFGKETVKNIFGVTSKGLATKFAAKELLNIAGEGGEELYQFMINNRSKELELQNAGLMDKEDLSDATKRYLNDGDAWTSFIFGALGAGVMVGGGRINASRQLQNIFSKNKSEILKEDDKRVENIINSISNIQSASNQMADLKSKEPDNKLGFERIKYDTFIPMAVTAAENGNLGHLNTLIEAAKDDKEGAQQMLGLNDDQYKEFKSNVDDILNITKNIEKNYQNNINKTGNWALARALTIADTNISKFTDLNNKATSEFDRLYNDNNSWTYDAKKKKSFPSTDFKQRKSLIDEIEYWNDAKKAYNVLLKQQLAKSDGKDNYMSTNTKKVLNGIDEKINVLNNELSESSKGYTEEQYNLDKDNYKLKKDLDGEITALSKEKVRTEVKLLENQIEQDFLNTEDGKAIFDKTRYKAAQKKAKKDINNAKSEEDVEAAIKSDETNTAKETADKKAKEAANKIKKKTKSVSETFGVTGNEEIEENPSDYDKERIRLLANDIIDGKYINNPDNFRVLSAYPKFFEQIMKEEEDKRNLPKESITTKESIGEEFKLNDDELSDSIGDNIEVNDITGTLLKNSTNFIEIEDQNGTIREIDKNNITSFKNLSVKETPVTVINEKKDKYIISEISENNVTVNGVEYTINLDKNGNIESLSPKNKPSQKIKNNNLLIAVEIERNKNEYVKSEYNEKFNHELKSNYQNLDKLLNVIWSYNMTETVATGLDKLYNGEKLNDDELLQVSLWLSDCFDRINGLFDKNNTKEENELLLNAYNTADVINSLLYNINDIEVKKQDESNKATRSSSKAKKSITTKQSKERVKEQVKEKVAEKPVQQTIEFTEKVTPIEPVKEIPTRSENIFESNLEAENKLIEDSTKLLNDVLSNNNPSLQYAITEALRKFTGDTRKGSDIVNEAIKNLKVGIDTEQATKILNEFNRIVDDLSKQYEASKTTKQSTVQRLTTESNEVTSSNTDTMKPKIFKVSLGYTNQNFFVSNMKDGKLMDNVSMDEINNFNIEDDDLEIELLKKGTGFNDHVYTIKHNGKVVGYVPEYDSNKKDDNSNRVKVLRETLNSMIIDSNYKVVTKVAGYKIDYNKEVDKNNRPVYSPLDSTKLSKNITKKHKGNAIEFLLENGGFAIGYVDTSNQRTGTKYVFNNSEDLMHGASDNANAKYIEARRRLTLDDFNKQVENYNGEERIIKIIFVENSSDIYDSMDKVPANKKDIREYFISSQEDIDNIREDIVDKYADETSGELTIAVAHPVNKNEVTPLRVYYFNNSQLPSKEHNKVYDYIINLIKNSNNGITIYTDINKHFVLSEKDKESLKNILKELSDKTSIEVLQLLDNNGKITDDHKKTLSGNSKLFWNIIDSSHIKINKALFNTAKGIQHNNPFIDNTNVPFNIAVSGFIKTNSVQDNPIRATQLLAKSKIDPIIDGKKPEIVNDKKDKVVKSEPITPATTTEIKEQAKTVEESIKESDKNVSEPIIEQSKPKDSLEQLLSGMKPDIGFDDNINLRQSIGETVAENSQEELDWFKKYFPNIPIKELDEIKDYIRNITKQGFTAWGAFTNAAIYLRDKFPVGTVYHEAFHVIFNLSLNDNERNTLLSKAEGETVIDKEEWLAEKFRDIWLNDKSNDKSIAGYITKVFRKLKYFIKSIFNSRLGSLHELAYRVKRGDYKDVKPGKFEEKSVRLYQEIEGWDYFKTESAVNTINSVLLNTVIPAIRADIDNQYREAKDSKKEELEELGYNKIMTLSVPEVLDFYTRLNNGDFTEIYRKVKFVLQSTVNNSNNPELKARVQELINYMFDSNDKQKKLIQTAVRIFNRDNDVIMTIKGKGNKLSTLDEYFENNADIESRQSEVYDVNFVSKPRSNDISFEVKNVLRYIPRILKKGDVLIGNEEIGDKVRNEFGLYEYYHFDDIDQRMIRLLNGSRNVDKIKFLLTKALKNNPEYQVILNKINEDKSFGTAMLIAYNRPYMKYEFLYKTYDKYSGIYDYIVKESGASTTDMLIRDWKFNFGRLSSNSEFLARFNSAASKLSSERNDIDVFKSILNKKAKDSDYELLEPILRSIGITTDIDTIKNNINKLSEEELEYIFSGKYGLENVIKDISKGINPYIIKDGSKKDKTNEFESFRPVFHKLANFIASNEPAMFENSHMNMAGDKVFSYIIPSFLSNFLYDMTTNEEVSRFISEKTKDKLYSDTEYDGVNNTKIKTNNIFLDRVIDIINNENLSYEERESALKNIVQVSLTDGTAETGKNDTPYTGMFDSDLKELALALFANNGNTTKAKFKLIPLSDSPNMVTITTDRLTNEQAIKAIIGLASGEYNRIQRVKEQNSKLSENDKIVNYHTDKNASTNTGYSIIPMFNGTKENPSANIKESEKKINEYYDKKTEEYFNQLVNNGSIILKDGQISKKSKGISISLFPGREFNGDIKLFKATIKNFLMNYTANVASFTTLTVGDPAFYKDTTDYFKRAKEIFSPKTNGDVHASYTFINENKEKETIYVPSRYNAITLFDENVEAPSYNDIKEAYDSLVDNGLITRELADKRLESYSWNAKKNKGNVNWADAQAFITPEMYRYTMIANRLWTDAMQVAYNHAINGTVKLEDLEVFQPIKPFMYDNSFNDQYGMNVPVQNKNSEFVLFPALIKNNPKLQALYDYMNSKSIHIANFESAVKAGLNGRVKFSDIVNNKTTVSLEEVKEAGKFKGMKVEFVDIIPTKKDKPIALSYKDGVIKIVEKEFIKKFEDKAWTVSTTQLDGSKSVPLDKDEFKTIDEFLTFVLNHEYAHSYILKEEGETTGEYETRVNIEGLRLTRNPFKIHSQDFGQRGIQQETPEHHIDAEGTHGTQVRVLTITDLDYSKDANGNFNTTYNVAGVEMNAEQLTDLYQELITENLKESYNNIIEEFLVGDKLNWEKVSEFLVANATANLMPQDFIDSLKPNKDGRIILPAFDPLFSNKMEALFTAEFRNKITKQKINQMALIQVSSVGLSKTLKLVFKSNENRREYEDNLQELEKSIKFAESEKLSAETLDLLTRKGYNEEMWNTLTEEEKEHAIKCATV